MSARYRAVNWNPQKRRYDLILGAGGLGFLLVFAAASLSRPHATVETTLIRGLGLLAFTLLHLILAIGPLARLDSRFLPLLYNRRHLGVAAALTAIAHASFALLQYHGGGDVSPVVSLLSSGHPVSHSRFPFEYFGVLALGILGVMAATSHDFWLSILGPEVWKALHMLVYPAFGLLVLHVALGALELNAGPGGAILVSSGAAVVLGLHLLAGVKEWRRDRAAPSSAEWLPICQPAEIELNRARGIMVGGERVAVYHHAGGYSAVSGVCRHQAGPLAEGRIIDGCIVCPWHGYQYDPANGTSPPPYQDRLATYRLRIHAGVLEVATEALPPGTRVEPVTI